ncbi:MAG: ABC transporter substrate-binding protein [Cyclobacteriaceae bacterium]|nr:ABC transporter substrate-binding protein [Cyclobacteriaceae bacterium]
MIVRSYKSGCVLLLLIFSYSAGYAQEYRKDYRHAKNLFEQGQYSEAMSAFKPLTVYDQQNPFPQYASYYYALSAQRLGYASVAKDMMLQIKKLYPTWDQMNEVNYWLVKIYFDLGEYFQGLFIASQIKDESFHSGLSDLKRVYLAKISDPETLKMILEDYPQEKEAARALVILLGKQPYHLQETELIENLIQKFYLSREQLVSIEALKPNLKESYRIALVMPFLASTLDPSPVKKRNQFVLDLYDGMKMATDSLSKQGIKLELLAYDNERNLQITRRVVGNEELKTADVIVGPLFYEESVPVQEFSLKNQISLIVNPVSTSSESSLNPFSFLYQPSLQTLGIRSAQWVANNVQRKNCMVYYGENTKDSVMASNFISKARELGINIVYVQRVQKEYTATILSTLASATEYDEWKNPTQFKLKKDSIGSIYVASDNELIYSKVINSVETRRDSIIVVGQESWLQDTSVDYAKFERTHVTLAAPNFQAFNSKTYNSFRKKYISMHGNLPPEYASIGYEFIMTIGNILDQFGTNFIQTMPEGFTIPGTLGNGFVWKPSRSNARVPFVTFKGGRLSAMVVD